MTEFAPVIHASDIFFDDGPGFRLDGPAGTGTATAGAGDVNGDGFADLLIGRNGNRGAYLVFGAAFNPALQTIAARQAADTAYFFLGEMPGDNTGNAISGAGDVNGDGFDDFLIGARYADPVGAAESGATYLVFGGATALEAFDLADGTNDGTILLSGLTAARGYRFNGILPGDRSGWAVSGGGDIDGDGFADLIVGAPYGDKPGALDSGASFIVRGGLANLGALDDADNFRDGWINLAAVGTTPGTGTRLDGENQSDRSGKSVAMVGDVNGDGFADVLVGAPYANPNSGADGRLEGAAYLVFGKSGLPANIGLSGADGANQVRFDGVVGAVSADFGANAVNGAGDINGDGFADIVIGAPYVNTYGGGIYSGAAYVVFGKSSFDPSLDLASLDGVNGFKLEQANNSNLLGISVAPAGDVNGDGFDDVTISAPGFDPVLPDGNSFAYNAGALFVLFGKATGFSSVIGLDSLNGDDGFRVEGISAGDRLGLGVQGPAAGDVNADGFDDILVASPGAASAYVIYGHRAETAVTRVGTALDQTINGGRGNDRIDGRGGSDTLIGWEGNDIYTLNDVNGPGSIRAFDTVVEASGAGIDTVYVASLDNNLSGSDSYRLAANVENAIVAGTRGFSLKGNGLANTLTGNGANNELLGLAGDDRLNGGLGNDKLIGGLGRDVMNGGGGNDRFDFNSIAETTNAARDKIAGFTHLADRLDLSMIDAISGGGNDAFAFQGEDAFTAAGQVRLQQSGANTIVGINTTGSSGAEAAFLLTGIAASTLTAVDFVL